MIEINYVIKLITIAKIELLLHTSKIEGKRAKSRLQDSNQSLFSNSSRNGS